MKASGKVGGGSHQSSTTARQALRDVLTTRNPEDRHGPTPELSSQELDDLCAYVLSL